MTPSTLAFTSSEVMASPTVFSAETRMPLAWVSRLRNASSLAAVSAPRRACAGVEALRSGAPAPVAFSTWASQLAPGWGLGAWAVALESFGSPASAARGSSTARRQTCCFTGTLHSEMSLGGKTGLKRPPFNPATPRRVKPRLTAQACLLLWRSAVPGDVRLDHLLVSPGEQGEADAGAVAGVGAHPLADHLALGVDDLVRTGELELQAHLLGAQRGLDEVGQLQPLPADVLAARHIGHAAHVLVQVHVQRGARAPALFGHGGSPPRFFSLPRPESASRCGELWRAVAKRKGGDRERKKMAALCRASRGETMRFATSAAAAATTLLLAAPGRSWAQAPQTDDEKAIYALGVLMGRSVGQFNLSKHEQDLLKKGLTDQLNA